MKSSIGVPPYKDCRSHEDLNPPVYYFLRSKIYRQVTQLQIRIPGPFLPECSLQCRWWDSQVEFRIVLDHLWKFLKNLRFTFICAYNVHCNTYIFSLVLIYFLLDSGGGKGWYKALAASPQPEDSESWSCYSAQEEWQQKSIPASGVLLQIKPDSNYKMKQK